MQKRLICDRMLLKRLHSCLNQSLCFSSGRSLTLIGAQADNPLYADIPKPRRDTSERKPYPTPIKVLIQRAKQEREARKVQPCRVLEHPPDNGLLVPELVEVAHRVYRARQSLLFGLSKLVKVVPVQRCRFCSEVHIGHVGHEIRTCTGPGSGKRTATHVWREGGVHDVVFFPKCFHLYDRVGKPRVGHDERHSVPRIPAILELCIQAGVNLDKFPTRRRTKPVYSIEGRIVDFEQVANKYDMSEKFHSENIDPLVDYSSGTRDDKVTTHLKLEVSNELGDVSIGTMESWFEMISGAKNIMEKYSVLTCGYCPEVQVGPKGHKVRMCKGTKHQARDGQHAWQEATIEDLVGPNYVWHVQDVNGPPLDNNLKRYYGKAPAVVELCVHAGAPVPDQYRSMMRLDVVPPNRDEVDLVA
ncbi:APO protein 3, mitochondrial [Ricinus communis]|uniref:Translation factor sui1, putative n=1 Tax=Ricinus communis TaxID=3988 RepID=B9RA65_RICCO|nr:APO protein 3, mitochondrial [Ricinus communis]EEF51692.1 translation factor sui1, putative [Ricinus communis]|eukprot:XP_002511090.1 APO protein 3, mitochondrial [Ricinus communis]